MELKEYENYLTLATGSYPRVARYEIVQIATPLSMPFRSLANCKISTQAIIKASDSMLIGSVLLVLSLSQQGKLNTTSGHIELPWLFRPTAFREQLLCIHPRIFQPIGNRFGA